jgi:hypothetical protein
VRHLLRSQRVRERLAAFNRRLATLHNEKRPYFKKFYVPIYRFDVVVAIGLDGAGINRAMIKAHLGELDERVLEDLERSRRGGSDARMICLRCQSGGQAYLISTESFNWTVRDLINMSHEALHVACFALSNAGVRLEDDGPNEALTYLHSAILESILLDLKPKRKPKCPSANTSKVTEKTS